MAIETDFSVDFSNGEIIHESGTTNYTVLELHRYLQKLADDAQMAGGANDDLLDITSRTPSERITDEIIELVDHTGTGGPRFHINDTAAKFLYGGSIRQGSGATEELYSGLRVLGSVVSTGTQLMVIQDKDHYQFTDTVTAPFWLDQTTPYNGSVTGAVLMRVLIKSRINGADIDGGKIIVTAREFGDTYSFFNVTLGQGEAVAAISTVDDPQNDTLQATVAAYTHVSNTEGYQTIDIGDGSGAEPYYSKWTYGTDDESDQLKSVWEWAKNILREGSAETIHGIDGEFFQGITHTYVYNTLSGDFAEDEEVVWGTRVVYNTLAGGTFAAGNYVRFSGGAAGRVMYDNGTTEMIVALEDTNVTVGTSDTFIEYDNGGFDTDGAATGVTATVNTTVEDNGSEGGLGILLADDETGLKHHVQVRIGSAPVDTLPVRGLTSGATAAVNTTVTPRTVNPIFLGSYVGSMIGGFGVGFDQDDLSFPDTVINLNGVTRNAPNNVTFSVNGLDIAAPDYVMVGEKDAGAPDFDWDQSTTNGILNSAGTVSVTVTAIPDNTPQAGNLRITADDGRRLRVPYSSHTGLVYTIPSFDFSGNNACASGNNVIVMPIDKAAVSDPETYTTVFDSAMTMFVRVRFGGDGTGTDDPIKTFEGSAALGSTGGSSNISRLADA